MALLYKHLYTYQCSMCRRYASASIKASGNLYRCVCFHRAWLRFLYATPITTAEEQALAQRGLVHSPGVDRPVLPTCAVCHDVLSTYAVTLPDGTPCHYRCSPAYLELRNRRHAEQRLSNEERRIALEGTKEQNSV